MPITLKLSHKFYERFGEDITNELVDVLNSMNAINHTEFRDAIAQNFMRFDGKLEHFRAGFDAKLEQRLAEFGRDLGDRLNQLESRLTWRMFAFWAPTAFAVIGSSAGVISLLLRR